MEGKDSQLGRQAEDMDTLRRLVPCLRDLLGRITEWKQEVKSCNAELQLICQKLQEGQKDRPKEQRTENSTSPNDDEILKAGGIDEGNISETKEDTVQEVFTNSDLRGNLEEAIEGCEQNCCNIDKDMCPQQECHEGNMFTREMYGAALVQAKTCDSILKNIMLLELELGTVTDHFSMNKDADVQTRSLNQSGNGKNKTVTVETGLDDDRKSSSQDESKSFQRGEVIESKVSDKDINLEQNNTQNISHRAKEKNETDEKPPTSWQSFGQWPECNRILRNRSVDLQEEDADKGSHADTKAKSDQGPLNELISSDMRKPCTGFDCSNINESCTSKESVKHEATHINRSTIASADNSDRETSGELSPDKGVEGLEVGHVNFGFHEEIFHIDKKSGNSSYTDQTDGSTNFESKTTTCSVPQKTILHCRKEQMDTVNNSENDPNACPKTIKVQEDIVKTSKTEIENLSSQTFMDQGQANEEVMSPPVELPVPQQETQGQPYPRHENIYSVQGQIRKHNDVEPENAPELIISSGDATSSERLDQRSAPLTNMFALDNSIPDVASKEQVIDSTQMTDESLLLKLTEVSNKETETNALNFKMISPDFDFPPDTETVEQKRINYKINQDTNMPVVTKQENMSSDTTIDQGQEHRNEVCSTETCELCRDEIKNQKNSHEECVYCAPAETINYSDPDNESNMDIIQSNEKITPDYLVGQGKVAVSDHVDLDDSIPNVSLNQQVKDNTQTPDGCLFLKSWQTNNRDNSYNDISPEISDANFDFPPDADENEQEWMDDKIVHDTNMAFVTTQENMSLDATMEHAQKHNNEVNTAKQCDVRQLEIKSQTYPLQQRVYSVPTDTRRCSAPDKDSDTENRFSNERVTPDDGVGKEKVSVSNEAASGDSIPDVPSNHQIIDNARKPDKSMFPKSSQIDDRDNSYNDTTQEISNTNSNFPPDIEVDEQERMGDKIIQDTNTALLMKQENVTTENTMYQELEHADEASTTVDNDVPQQQTKTQGYPSQERGFEIRRNNGRTTQDDTTDQRNVSMSNMFTLNDSIPDFASQHVDSTQVPTESAFLEATELQNETTNNAMHSKIKSTHFDAPPYNKMDGQKPIMHDIRDINVTSFTERETLGSDTMIDQEHELTTVISIPVQQVVSQQDTESQVFPSHRNANSMPAQLRSYNDQDKESDLEIRTTNDKVTPQDSVYQAIKPMSYSFVLQKGLTPAHKHKQDDESCIPDLSRATDQEKYILSPQSENERDDRADDYMSTCNSPLKDSSSSLKENDHGTNPTNYQIIAVCKTTNSKREEQAELTLPINTGFGNGQELKSIYCIASSKEEGEVHMDTSCSSHAEVKSSDVDVPGEIKSRALEEEGADYSCGPTPNNDILNGKAVTSSMEEKSEQLDSDTDPVHLYTANGQLDPERKQQLSGSNSGEHCVTVVDDVNTENLNSVFDNGNCHSPETQSMDSIISNSDSHPPSQPFITPIIAEETYKPTIAPSRLLSSPLPSSLTADNKLSSIDNPIEELTSSFNSLGMRQRIKTVPKMEVKANDETKLRKSRLLPSHHHLGPAVPDKSIAFKTYIDCCRPIRADSHFNIVHDTVSNQGDAFQAGGGQATFVAPFHGLYSFSLHVQTDDHQDQELSIGIELNDHETGNQFWLCLQSVIPGKTQTFMTNTVVLKPGDLIYAKVEHVRGFNLGLQSVCFEGQSLYRGVNK